MPCAAIFIYVKRKLEESFPTGKPNFTRHHEYQFELPLNRENKKQGKKVSIQEPGNCAISQICSFVRKKKGEKEEKKETKRERERGKKRLEAENSPVIVAARLLSTSVCFQSRFPSHLAGLFDRFNPRDRAGNYVSFNEPP